MSFPAKSYLFLRTLGPSPADQIHHFQLDELKYELLVSRHVCSIPSPTCLYIHPQLRNSPPSTSSSITTGNPWHAKGQWTLGQILTTWVSIRFKDPLSWCWWLHCQDWDSYPVGNNHVNRLECKYASDTLRSYSLRSHVAKKQRNALCIRVFFFQWRLVMRKSFDYLPIPLNLHYQDFSSQSLHSQLQTITSDLCILISNSNFNQPTNLQTKLLKSWHGAYFHDLQVSRRLCAGSPWTPKSLPFPQLSGCQWPHPHFDAQGSHAALWHATKAPLMAAERRGVLMKVVSFFQYQEIDSQLNRIQVSHAYRKHLFPQDADLWKISFTLQPSFGN